MTNKELAALFIELRDVRGDYGKAAELFFEHENQIIAALDEGWIRLADNPPTEEYLYHDVLTYNVNYCNVSYGKKECASVKLSSFEFHDGLIYWRHDDGSDYPPTHWRPLPAPPKEGE